MKNADAIRKDVLVWARCAAALLLGLHTWLSGHEFHPRLKALKTQCRAISKLGEVPPALAEMQRHVAANGGAKQEPLADWLAARTDEVSVQSETDTPLPGGWIRRDAVLAADDADYAALERLLWGLASQEPHWVLESGEWTPRAQPGRGRALLALATLLPPPLPPPAANGND